MVSFAAKEQGPRVIPSQQGTVCTHLLTKENVISNEVRGEIFNALHPQKPIELQGVQDFSSPHRLNPPLIRSK
jgi:hypothetical protein